MADYGEGHCTLPLFDPLDESSYFVNFTGFQDTDDDLNFDFAEPSNQCPASWPISNELNHCGGGAVGEYCNPMDDPLLWIADSEMPPLQIESGVSNSIGGGGVSHQQPPSSSGIVDIMQTPLQGPLTPAPFQCTFCQVLREIIHTNGNHATKLEIHGRLGIICHAILENRENNQFQMFDFRKQSVEDVKQFLLRYCEERRQAGYIMLQDPLMVFYEALCPGLDSDEDFNMDDFLQASPIDLDILGSAEEVQANQQGVDGHAGKLPKTFLSVQRERAANLRMSEVGKYFNVPIEEAAKKVGVCPTVIKKICRKHGIYRWPHRKIKSMERKMVILEASLKSADAEVRERAADEIEILRVKMNEIYGGIGK